MRPRVESRGVRCFGYDRYCFLGSLLGRFGVSLDGACRWATKEKTKGDLAGYLSISWHHYPGSLELSHSTHGLYGSESVGAAATTIK